MENLFSFVTYYIDVWGNWAILIGMALESANIPIPSELIFGFAGYLVFLGRLDFTSTVIYGVAGGLLGSIFSYFIGYYGGRPFVAKYGKYFFMSEAKVQLAESWFERYGLIVVLLGRLLPVIRTFISLPAGFAKVNFAKFVLYTIIGSVPWTIALIYAGMALGENWHAMNAVGHQASLVVVFIIGITAIYLLYKKRSRIK
ncbi:MAG: associated protein [Firmicutes bacterium]|nr:associated protein [Bacillota bacterium]